MIPSVTIIPGIKPDEIKELYLSAFPEEERREWSLLCRLMAEGTITIYGIYSESELAGFFSSWTLSNGVRYIEHFATLPQFRNKGIGAAALGLFTDMACSPVLVEVERPGSTPEADRRIGFYRRCGFIAYDQFNYIQPPYSPGLPEVPLMLMATGEINPTATQKLLHREVYNYTHL